MIWNEFWIVYFNFNFANQQKIQRCYTIFANVTNWKKQDLCYITCTFNIWLNEFYLIIFIQQRSTQAIQERLRSISVIHAKNKQNQSRKQKEFERIILISFLRSECGHSNAWQNSDFVLVSWEQLLTWRDDSLIV